MLLRHSALIVCLGSIAPVARSGAQSAAAHAEHHPPTDTAMAVTPRSSSSPNGAASPMGGMMKMPPRETYPSLMTLARLSPEERAQLRQDSDDRMLSGTAMMAAGVAQVSVAARRGELTAMQNGLVEVREGLARLEAGLAGRVALDSAPEPSSLALSWFRSEMSLLAPGESVDASFAGGFSRFHLAIMVILVTFALTVVWIHFQKLRRIEELISSQRLGTAGVAPAEGAGRR